MIIKNYKKKSPRSRKVKLFSILILVCLLLAASAAFIVYKSRQADEAMMTQKNKDEAQTQSAKKVDAEKSSDTKTTPSTNSTSQEVETTSTVILAIDSFNQSNHSVNAAASITGANADGVCVFLFTSEGDKPVTREVGSTMNEQRRTCSISIPEVEFNKLGTWKLNVTFYLNNQKSEASKDVTIS
jgi:hypothetical protein